jgi:hypothetical protein
MEVLHKEPESLSKVQKFTIGEGNFGYFDFREARTVEEIDALNKLIKGEQVETSKSPPKEALPRITKLEDRPEIKEEPEFSLPAIPIATMVVHYKHRPGRNLALQSRRLKANDTSEKAYQLVKDQLLTSISTNALTPAFSAQEAQPTP